MRFSTLCSFLFFFSTWSAFATHNRSGEITYKHVGGNGNTYEVTVTTFTDPGSVAADRDSLIVEWGDGTFDTIPRVQIINLNGEVKQNIYRGVHTYGGFGCFEIKMQDLNRVAGINNVNAGNSVDIPFFVADSLCILDPAIWGAYNNSPQFSFPAVDTAYVNQLFEHPLGAFDAEGDSIALTFYDPMQDDGFPVTNYVPLTTWNPGSTVTLDQSTLTFIWDKPTQLGVVNVGILISEYRRRYNPDGSVEGVTKIGSVKRDLQIFILADNNTPPVIAHINDTCVIAGSLLSIPVHVTDVNVGQSITTSATGGPFLASESPATLSQVPPSGTGIWNGVFQWQTTCNHAYPDYYIVTIVAKDNYTGGPASDVETFRIKVVAPPPENLTATPQGNTIQLNWLDPYTCSDIERFRGFSVWRRQGPNPFDIDTCTPGLEGKGYTKIASDVQDYSYNDDDVVIGVNYCYRVLAEFGTETSLGYLLHFVESLPSNEACAYLERDLPVITHVSVQTTDATNGSMFIDWTNPIADELDTTQHPGPYKYNLYRTQGFNGGSPQLIFSTTSNTFAGLDDTMFVDTPLNTLDNPYRYFVSFLYTDAGAFDSLGQTATASSVYLNVNFASHALTLDWEEHVPWDNYSYVIYRKDPGSATFDSLTTVASSPYTDSNLMNDSLYCYKILSVGSYADTGFVNPLFNWSEEKCGVPKDTVGPCPPMLAITNICNTDDFTHGDFTNFLQWTKPAIDCGGDAIKYYVYYAASETEGYALVDSFHFVNDTTFEHMLNNTLAGCYYVVAVDSYYNSGLRSNIVCIENCPEYNLPNTFTPNNDGHNERFVPLLPFRFIEKVNMKIFTSWGSLVYETSDPALGWDGVNQTTGNDAAEGTYYYVCEVYEERLGGDGKPDFVLDGFIHLYR